MPETPADGVYEATCPHCKKTFEAELLRGGAERYQGFKCPHCRLFVSLERVDEEALPAEETPALHRPVRRVRRSP